MLNYCVLFDTGLNVRRHIGCAIKRSDEGEQPQFGWHLLELIAAAK
jgi:hypothetical protein